MAAVLCGETRSQDLGELGEVLRNERKTAKKSKKSKQFIQGERFADPNVNLEMVS